MATVETTRLGLNKQAHGDNPGDWEVDLNLGLDNAEMYFQLGGTGDPNGAEDARFIGQRYYDDATGYWYTATDTDLASNGWVSDFTTLDPDINHPAPASFAGDYPHGHLNASLKWVDDENVQLEALGPDGDVYADISGVRRTLTGPFVFNVGDLEGIQTWDASTLYYLYLDDSAVPGTPEPIVSKTAPDDIGGTSPGYHPTEADWRNVGSIYSDADSDVQGFTVTPGGLVIFGPAHDAGHIHDLSPLATQAAYRSLSLNIPKTATSVLIQCLAFATNNSYLAIAQSSATGTLPAAGPPALMSDAGFEDAHAILNIGASDYVSANDEVPIADRTAPAIKYGTNDSIITTLEFLVRGYRDLWVPRGY